MVNVPLDLNDIKINDFGTQPKSFENLCKELLEHKYNISSGGFILGDDKYPCIESPVVSINGNFIGFQSKFSADPSIIRESFFGEKDISTCKSEDLKLDKNDRIITILYIFTLHKSIGGISDKNKLRFKELIEESLNHQVDIIWYTKPTIEERVKDIHNIRDYYLNSDVANARLLLKEKLETPKVPNEIEEKIIVSNFGLSGNVEYNQRELANRKHNSFILNKFLYATTDSLKILDQLEKQIADDTFTNISDETKDRDKTYLEVLQLSAEKLKPTTKTMKDNEKTIDILVPTEDTKHGLFVNYGLEGKAEFEVKKNNNILFIDKR